MNSPRFRGLLERLCLHRPELRAWALYDWANSAMVTIIITAVFPIFFSRVASTGMEPEEATQNFARATTIALIVIALSAPVLGAIADHARIKKKLLAAFMTLGVTAVCAMFAIGTGEWLFAATLFVLANIGAMGSFVFYDSLLPHVATDEEVDQLSTSGYALGYLGGGIVLVIVLMLIQKPEWFGLSIDEENATLPTRIGFVLVGIWWFAFSLPLFLRIREPETVVLPRASTGAAIGTALRRLRRTAGELVRFKHAFLMLIAFLIYNDGITTIYRMATIFGKELDLDSAAMIQAIVLVQFVGIPFTLGFGWVATRIGAKRAILCGLVVYLGVCVLGFGLQTERGFFALAILIGMVQGGTQALSRSLFASMIPKSRSAEFFGLFAVLDRFGAVLGPIVFVWVIGRFGSSRPAILALVAFFIVGGLLLSRVDIEEGRRRAKEE